MEKLISRDALTAITVAGSGHTGGALSSSTIFGTMAAAKIFRLDKADPSANDRLVVAGHYAGSALAFLGRMGSFNLPDFYAGFRRGTAFEGHVTADIYGSSWSTGRLGQELSAACGHAYHLKHLEKNPGRTVYAITTDGGKQEGQGDEARRFASHFGLDNLVEIMDFNRTQISGNVADVMGQDFEKEYDAAGFDVYKIDGHSPAEICGALSHAAASKNCRPKFVLAETEFAHGVPSMQKGSEYHGKAPTMKEYLLAMEELGMFPADIEQLRSRNPSDIVVPMQPRYHPQKMAVGRTAAYMEPVECRTAIGEALRDLGKLNKEIIVVDADLGKSTKTELFKNEFADGKRFIQCGVAEQNAMTIAGVLGTYPNRVFIAGFSTFMLNMALSQVEMNLFNETDLTIIGTHQGLDVGEDGKTHQCLNYLGLANSLGGAGLKAVFPADGNQARKVIESLDSGSTYVGVGRSKAPIIKTSSGGPFYGADYCFEYGKADVLREGSDATILTYGNVVGKSLDASDTLRKEGLGVGVINISCPLMPDGSVLEKAAKNGPIFTVEDHYVSSGLGMLVGGELGIRVEKIGVPSTPKFPRSDSPNNLYRRVGLLPDQIADRIRKHPKR